MFRRKDTREGFLRNCSKMPGLNPDILREIGFELLKGEQYPSKCLNKFVLSGKEPFLAFQSLIPSFKSVKITGDSIAVKFVSF